RRGLLAAAGGVIRLQRQIPFKIASELALTGEPITAERAHELGLVNRVAPQGKALDVALELARPIASNAPVAVQQTKRVMHETAARGSDWNDEVWDVNAQAMKAVCGSAEAKEGARAAAEKRQPVWTGRGTPHRQPVRTGRWPPSPAHAGRAGEPPHRQPVRTRR